MKSLITLLLATTLAAVTASAADKLVIKGSDTLGAKLVPQVAEAFKAANPGVVFEIAAEGSTTGIAAIIDGTANIGMASRRPKATEESAAMAKGVNMKRTVVAYDGMAVIVNDKNPVTQLTLRQVEQIFTGDLTDWSGVGGNAGAFSIYTRNTSSGTYSEWKEQAMNKRDYAPSSQKMAGNEQIAAEVAKNPNGVGYVGLAYAKAPGVKIVAIVNAEGKATLPDLASVHAHSYPYSRPTFFLTNGEPTGLTAKFIAFMLGTEGQAIAEQVGFVPVAAGK